MVDTSVLSGLPLDVYSRLESLFFHVRDIRNRETDRIYGQLVEDFEATAVQLVTACKAAVKNNPNVEVLKLHELVDKLTREWHTVTELIATVDLGESYLGQFQPYIQQATKDIGLSSAADQYILIPTFGEYFALTRFEYSTTSLAMLKLPLSALNAPWEWSVIWHEVAGLKVQKVKEALRQHWQNYADEKEISPPSEDENQVLLDTLFNRILTGKVIDSTLRAKLKPVLERVAGNGNSAAVEVVTEPIWSLDWLEQLFEDACSVLAFGEDFIFTFEKILSRTASKLTADRAHPDLPTRLKVANRLLALKNGSAPAPADVTERLTDELLWSFIKKQTAGSDGYLPVAFEKPGELPEIRRKLIDIMGEFKQAAGVLSPYPASLSGKVRDLLGSDRLQNTQAQPVAGFLMQNDLTRQLDKHSANSDLNALLEMELSHTDDLDITGHGSNSAHRNMYIYVHNQDHKIYYASHV